MLQNRRALVGFYLDSNGHDGLGSWKNARRSPVAVHEGVNVQRAYSGACPAGRGFVVVWLVELARLGSG